MWEKLHEIGHYCENCKYCELAYDGEFICRNAPRMKDHRIKFSVIRNTLIAGLCEDYDEV